MMPWSSFVQKAQSLIDPANFNLPSLSSSDDTPSKASLFRLQFRLPDSQNPLQEITADLVLPLPNTSGSGDGVRKVDRPGTRYTGRLHLSERFICFSTQPTSFLPSSTLSASTNWTGQTHGTGPSGNGFTLPLSCIRRVERLHSASHVFSLALTTWNGLLNKQQEPNFTPQRVILQLAGSRQACERFCDTLKKGLREGMKEVENLRLVVTDCYSEYLLSGAKGKLPEEKGGDARQPPDAGLGMLFRYPGDARKLRDRSKMRLWGEYFRGMFGIHTPIAWHLIDLSSRKWAQCDAGSPAYIPQVDSSWTAQSIARRNLGAYIGLLVSSSSLAQIVPGNFGSIRRPGVPRDRRDREGFEPQPARVPWVPERRRHRSFTTGSHCL